MLKRQSQLVISFRIRELREAKGWSPTELAGAANVTQATVSRIENRKVDLLDLAAFERIVDALEVDAAVLIRHDRGGASGDEGPHLESLGGRAQARRHLHRGGPGMHPPSGASAQWRPVRCGAQC